MKSTGEKQCKQKLEEAELQTEKAEEEDDWIPEYDF